MPLPSATRVPAAARPCHTRPTQQQPSGSPAKERTPTPNSASGERGAGSVERSSRPSPVPDMAGDREHIEEKKGNASTMQQLSNVCINEVTYCCRTSLLRCCCTWCLCCSTAAVVHHWLVVLLRCGSLVARFYGTFSVLPVYHPSADYFFASVGAGFSVPLYSSLQCSKGNV